ncbi:MAG: DUF5050 domain-containing protein [Coriobacteriia bacterium]|nr:DUF5050 domain-containing protein [Coriobacteriia bacterium]
MKRGLTGIIAAVMVVALLSGCAGGQKKPASGNVASSAPQYGNSNGNLINKGYVVSSGDYVFYVNNLVSYDCSIYRLDIKTSQKTVIARNCSGSLNVYDNKLFYSNQVGIVSCDFAGKNFTRYYPSGNDPSFVLYDGALYIANDGIYKMDITTKKLTKLSATSGEELNITDDKIYYTTTDGVDAKTLDDMSRGDGPTGAYIYQMNLDGTGNKKVSDTLVSNLIESNGDLYYRAYATGYLEKLDPATMKTEVLSKEQYEGFNMLDDTIYCYNSSNNIYALDLTGKLLKTYDVGFSTHFATIGVAGNSLYVYPFGQDLAPVYRLDTNSGKTEKMPPFSDAVRLEDDSAIKEATGWDNTSSEGDSLNMLAGIQLKKSVVLICQAPADTPKPYKLVEVYPTLNSPKMRILASYDYAQCKTKGIFSAQITSCAGEKATITSTFNKTGELTGLTSTVNDPTSFQLEKKGQEYHQPASGSSERKVILDAVRPAIEKDLGQKVEFVVNFIGVENGFAFVSARPQQPGGKAFDYKNIPYSADAARHDMFDGGVSALLHYQNGTWKLLNYDFGSTDVAYSGWWNIYGAPCRIFGDGLPVNAWIPQ